MSGRFCLPLRVKSTLEMTAILISLLRNVDTFEHIRSAICAARDYERERLGPADAGVAASVL
ncbi:hypothetical protein RHEC894_CH01293 [Rhizobium sp. CIAT894]|nr:hypothetical protein RHEC894_CH01293 [Rhizobium sp. CIAT894]